MGTTRPPGTPAPRRTRPPFNAKLNFGVGLICGFIASLHLHNSYQVASGIGEIAGLFIGCTLGVAFAWAWLMFVLRALVDMAILSYTAVIGFIIAMIAFRQSPWLILIAIVGLIVVLTAVLWDSQHPHVKPMRP